jgi:hypothetical protein
MECVPLECWHPPTRLLLRGKLFNHGVGRWKGNLREDKTPSPYRVEILSPEK